MKEKNEEGITGGAAMEREELKVSFDTALINEALQIVVEQDMLCQRCLTKTASMEAMNQGDFCPTCQHTVTAVLGTLFEQAIKQLLRERGLPENAVKLDHQ